MAVNYNPKCVTSNLLLNIDATNPKSNKLENLLKYSEAINTSPWNKYVFTGSMSLTENNSSSPVGDNTATQLNCTVYDVSGMSFYQDISSIVGDRKYTASIYFKPGTMTGNMHFAAFFLGNSTEGFNGIFNASTGSLISTTALSATSNSVGNGWYRLLINLKGTNALNTSIRFQIYIPGTGTCFFWGAQLSNAYSPIDYVKTSANAISNYPNIYNIIDTSSPFQFSNTQYIGYTNNSIEFSRNNTTKIGGFLNATATGNLSIPNFLYNDHTWEILFRINDRNSGGYDATEGESAIAVYRGYHSGYMYYSGELRYHVWSGTTSYQVANWSLGTSGTEIIQGQWAHVTVTKSGDTWTKYLNGKKISTTTRNISSTGIGTTNDLRFGSGNSGGSYSLYSKYNLALSRMYNRALTDAEVYQNFNSIRGRYGL